MMYWEAATHRDSTVTLLVVAIEHILKMEIG
jgi:hypothetical protein